MPEVVIQDDTDNDDLEGEEGSPKKTTSGKVLREKLESTLSENQALKGQLLIHDSGLGHLTEKQRRAVIREAQEEGGELTIDLLKSTAKELGYTDAPKSIKQSTNGNDGDDDGSDDGENLDSDDNSEPLNSMDAIERAIHKASSPISTGSFEDKLKAAKSTAEVEALIRNEGHKVGIVHEWDTE